MVVLIGIGKALFWCLVLAAITLIGFVAAVISACLTFVFLYKLFEVVKNLILPAPAKVGDLTTTAEKIKSSAMMLGIYCASVFVALGVFNMWIPEVKIPLITRMLY